MTRNIISKFIIVLIVLFTALSLFWFFKTSAIKKQTLAFIANSSGRISATSVSVSGFPLEQKLTIDGLKFQLSTTFPNLPLIPLSHQYQVEIKKLEAQSSILSKDFKITKIEDVSYQDQSGVSNLLQFNQPPQANFVVSKGELTKFSYQDAGYKILDAGNNLLFENGNSTISFESVLEGDKYNNKVKVEFKDVGISNNFIENTSVSVDESVLPDPVSSDADQQNIVDNSIIQPEPENETKSDLSGNLIKKSFVLDLEYIVSKSSSPIEIPALDVKDDNASNDTIVAGSNLNSVNIRNFEISSPLYKININGEISSFQDQGFPISSFSVRIEKFDNILIYLKKPILDIANVTTSNSQEVIDDGADKHNPTKDNVPTSDFATAPASNQKPEIDVISIIKELSKKNLATNDEIAVFDFRQEQGKDLLINETSLSEIMSQIFPFPVNNVANPVSSTAIPDDLIDASIDNVEPSVPKVEEVKNSDQNKVPAPHSGNVN